jgi:hypothetical protein
MDNVIKFDPRDKILEKSQRYVADEEVFLEEARDLRIIGG